MAGPVGFAVRDTAVAAGPDRLPGLQPERGLGDKSLDLAQEIPFQTGALV